jgi:hypothetical protein
MDGFLRGAEPKRPKGEDLLPGRLNSIKSLHCIGDWE